MSATTPKTSSESGRIDVFPGTLITWINRQMGLGEEGRRQINRHIMSVYAWPLKVYFLGSSARWLGEPDEIINGFFANRLAREEFLERWRESSMRLRRWLINAFCYYLMEVRKSRKRNDSHPELSDDPITFSGNPDEAVDRAFAISLVHRAIAAAAARCEEENLADHWSVFMRHYLNEEPYDSIAPDFKVTAARAAVMARTASRKFQAAIRELLAADGGGEARVDEEIAALLEAIRP